MFCDQDQGQLKRWKKLQILARDDPPSVVLRLKISDIGRFAASEDHIIICFLEAFMLRKAAAARSIGGTVVVEKLGARAWRGVGGGKGRGAF